MAGFDRDDESLDEQQSEALRTVARTLDGLAELADEGFPEAPPNTPGDAPQAITATDSQFAETWQEIRACVQTHLRTSDLNEYLGRDPFAVVSIDAYPPGNRSMTLSVRYEQQGALKIDIENP